MVIGILNSINWEEREKTNLILYFPRVPSEYGGGGVEEEGNKDEWGSWGLYAIMS